jgi:hypothetical protein
MMHKFIAILTLALMPSLSQAQDALTLPPATILPLVTLCSPLEPDLGLYQKYGEIAFVEGDASLYIPGGKTVNGKLTIYMKPGFDENTFTIMFQVGPLYCMVASGRNALPAEPNDLNGVGEDM